MNGNGPKGSTLTRTISRLSCLAIVGLFLTPAKAQTSKARPDAVRFKHSLYGYDLSQPESVTALTLKLDAEIAESEMLKGDKNEENHHKTGYKSTPERTLPNRPIYSGKVLKEMRRIVGGMSGTPLATELRTLRDMEWAQVHKSVVPSIGVTKIDVIGALFNLRGLTLNASGRGNRRNPAANLSTYESRDLSMVDPKSSTFWSRPVDLPNKDLFNGFDRTAIKDFNNEIVTYDKAHTGYGAHAGFNVTWRGEQWKCKFGEDHSEPFSCRIFRALGFHAYATDFVPELRVAYCREILTQFNSRKTTTKQILALGLPITSLSDRVYLNPFDCIQYAVLRDATHVPVQELRSRLFPKLSARTKAPEQNPKLYDHGFEAQIDHLVMKGANIRQSMNDDIGSWDFNDGENGSYRETRGLGLLNAWLGNWDVRWGNNHLDLIKDEQGDGRHLVHVMSDLGTAFGNSTGYLRRIEGKLRMGLLPNAPNAFEWSFTAPMRATQESVPIRFYMPLEKNRAFYEMNIDDARWMARLIGQLTENQIKQALIGSGMDAATGLLLLEKLVSRRDNMVRDFGLAVEIPMIRPSGPDKHLTYDSRSGTPFSVQLPNGVIVAAHDTGEMVVVDGRLMVRSAADRMKLSKRKRVALGD